MLCVEKLNVDLLDVVTLSAAKLKLLLTKMRAIFRGICQAENCQK
jgi:hypothetical protein